MEIKNAYLQWVGAAHYPTYQDYIDEALQLGVSKRIMNADTGKALLEPDTVVFLAHDNGEYHECPDCKDVIECPECRVRKQKFEKLGKRIEDLNKKYQGKENNRSRKAVEKAREEMKALSDQNEFCKLCAGTNKVETGSGGKVEFNNGEVWDHRKYIYWRRQPKSFDVDDFGGIKEIKVCDRCSGRGRIPDAKIFGLFIPSGIEYVLTDEDSDKMKDELEANGFRTKTKVEIEVEARRGCGFRQPGAYYVVTEKSETQKKEMNEVVQELATKGVISPEAIKLKGNFAHFEKPIELEVKRFRGIKKMDMSLFVEIEEQAEDDVQMTLEALEE